MISDSSALLETTGLHKCFGGVTAVDQLEFQAFPGQIGALIGPNGAGKSSVINLITGSYRADAGSIVFNGLDITRSNEYQVARRGIARTFQNLALFPDLSVLDNVALGHWSQLRPGMLRSLLGFGNARTLRRARARALEELDFCGVSDLGERALGSLSFGAQRWVEIARSLAMHPSLILMDEPAAGLTLAETERLGGLLRRIRGRGIAVVLIEHDMGLVMNVSDRVTVLERGRRIACGTPREIQQNPAVINAYLGAG